MLENAETLNTQAIELAYHGDYKEAIACFKRALSMETSNYLLWFNLGLTYRDAGEFKEAKAALEQALAINDDDQEVLETLALLCNSLGEFHEAISYCTDALQLNQSNAHIWNTTGVILFNNGEYDTACTAFEQAVMYNPYYYDAVYNLRDTYDELGNTVGAAMCSQQMKSLSKGNHDA